MFLVYNYNHPIRFITRAYSWIWLTEKKLSNFLWKLVHCFSVNDEEVRLMLWDTAGQEEFDAITKAYYRGKILMRWHV